ncbi:MAG: glycosyltransferase family 4 protein [candidate division Zixibacteria bacterium]|nr:glycosyltransferase family 4 protein [candidate division Zixibacteria bacterium]
MKKILMAVGWEVQQTKKDDQGKYPADLLLPDQKYWFFKHWPEDNLQIEVMGYRKIPLLSLIEKKFLHFHLFQSLRVLPKMKKYDLLIFFHSQIGLIPALFKSIFRIKTPLVLIDVEGIGRKNSWYLKPLIRKALSAVNLLFYLARLQKEDYEKHYPEIIRRTKFIPFGLDIDRFKPQNSCPANYIISFGYGGLDARDWPTLFEAFGKLSKKMELVVIGKKGFSKKELKGLLLPKGVRTIPFSPLETLKKYIESSLFVILPLPYRAHAHGQMSLLESMALGKAVIVAKTPGVIDYVEDRKNALFYELANPSDLREKIEFLLNNPNETERLGINARKSVELLYNEEKMAQDIYFAVKDLYLN